MKKSLCLACAMLVLAGCATTAEYANKVVDYGRQAGAWVGQKVESLYASEGEPNKIETQPDGGKVVEYRQPPPAAPATDAAAPAAAAAVTAANVVPCTTRYKVDSTGTIRSWTIDGTGCKAVEVEATPHP